MLCPENRLERLPLLLLLLRRRLLLMDTKFVLFVCVENACRSLMAEAAFNAAPPSGWRAISAGTRPARSAFPRTAAMLEEVGLALPAHPPRTLSPELIDQARIRVTMGCLDDASCPVHLKTRELRDWALPDPAKLNDADFRAVRDQVLTRVEALRQEIGATDRPTLVRVPSGDP